MSRIFLSFPVAAPLDKVKNGFTEELFLALAPGFPFPKVKLLRFDGCQKGDWVILKLFMFPIPQLWESEITADEESTHHWQFVDEGRRLPFFLKQWKHIHRVESRGSHSVIIEDISFEGKVPNFLLKPLLKYQFSMRKPIYEKRFGKVVSTPE